MLSRKQEVSNNLKKLSRIKTAMQMVYNANQNIIATLAWENRHLQRNMRDLQFIDDMYRSFPTEKLADIPDATYAAFLDPLNSVVNTGSSYIDLEKKRKRILANINEFESSLSSSTAAFAVASGATAGTFLTLGSTVTFDNSNIESIIQAYLADVKVDEDIAYIQKQLPTITPDISKEFEHFLKNYYASQPDEDKYQELIGCRSLFYQRFIYSIAEERGIKTPKCSRCDQIKSFIYGSNTAFDPDVDTSIAVGKNLWDELSKQSTTGYSVKMGNVSSVYVQLVFNMTIITISTLLKQREIHYIP